MENLEGRIAVVTDASMGVGAASARSLAAAGCHVALIARGRAALDAMVESIRRDGGLARAYCCDLRDATAVAAALRMIEIDMGPVSILVNNAGAGIFTPRHSPRLDEILLPLMLPLGATLAACHALVPGMILRGEGQIINLASPAAGLPLPYLAPSIASRRHALLGLSLSLREELQAYGIGVSLLCPPKVEPAGFGAHPGQVGAAVLRAVRANPREYIFPLSLRLLVRLHQLAPRLSVWLLHRLDRFQRPRR